MKRLLLLIVFVLIPLSAQAKIILADTDDTLQVITASAVTTTFMYASWADITTTTLTPGASDAQVTTAVTTTLVAAPGTSTQRQVKGFTIRNSHASSSNAITVQFHDGATATELVKYTLLAGETLQWTEDRGFVVMDASGQLKAAIDTEMPAAVALGDNTVNPTVPGVAAFLMCYDGSTWDRCQGGLTATDNNSVAAAQVPTLTLNIPYVYNGSAWVRQTGDATNGLDVDVTRIGGQTPAFGTGVRSSATQRVTIATDDVVPVSQSGSWSLAANQSVNVAQMNGAATTMGNGVSGTGVQRVTIASDSTGVVGATQSGTWTVQPGNTANTTAWLVSQTPATSGGLSISRLLSAASTNGTNAKASAGQVYGWYITNSNASARFVKLYNKASAPTCGTDTPVMTLLIPGASTGAGTNVAFPSGIAFGTGIGYCTTTGVADADTGAVAANEVILNLFYK